MQNAVFVAQFDGRRAVLMEDLGDFVGGIAVDHEEQLTMCARGLEKVQAIGFGLAESLLVTVDDLLVVVVDAAQGDESPALSFGARQISGDIEGLRVHVKAGLGVRLKNAFALPFGQEFGSSAVEVLPVVVLGP